MHAVIVKGLRSFLSDNLIILQQRRSDNILQGYNLSINEKIIATKS